jgi:hypothetical protein
MGAGKTKLANTTLELVDGRRGLSMRVCEFAVARAGRFWISAAKTSFIACALRSATAASSSTSDSPLNLHLERHTLLLT